MFTADTTTNRGSSSFRKLIYFGIAAKLSILAIFLFSKFV
tara:strand:+ start:804 stop:923 length:120 start_codon:yes stop_codon:yes gene_type:complete